jgi:hypothetical protein
MCQEEDAQTPGQDHIKAASPFPSLMQGVFCCLPIFSFLFFQHSHKYEEQRHGRQFSHKYEWTTQDEWTPFLTQV